MKCDNKVSWRNYVIIMYLLRYYAAGTTFYIDAAIGRIIGISYSLYML